MNKILQNLLVVNIRNLPGPACILLLLVLFFSGFASAASESPLRLSLESLGQGQFQVSLHNISDEDLSVLSWGTPFEQTISADLFDIRAANKLASGRLIYRGRRVKRASPLPEDYMQIAAGEMIQRVVSLTEHYLIPEYAEYQLTFNNTVEYRSAESAFRSVGENSANVESANNKIHKSSQANSLRSAALTTAPLTALLVPVPETAAAQVGGYLSCSVALQSELNQALQASEEITNAARDGLASLTGDAQLNSPRYRYWFGQFSQARFDKVYATYEAASNVMADGLIEFDCSCDEAGLYAYVIPIDPYRIYLCPNFWRASLIGTDSRAGTILHELTHFPEVSGTTDHAYGQRLVANLASENPERAVENADSYEYFAENTPAIAISNLVVFTEIAVGNAVSSDLRQGESTFYKVTGAELIELTSTTGDADLYVYDSAESNNLLCRSRSQTALDSCELNPDAVAYIEVKGYIDSQYSLLAQAADDPTDVSEPELPVVDPQGGNSGEQNSGGAVSIWLLLLIVLRRGVARVIQT